MNLPLEQRIALLKKLKQVILSHEPVINEALKKDLNKSEFESYISEVGFVIQEIELALKKVKCWAKPKRVCSPIVQFPAKSEIHYVPYGKVLIIGPWNYPFQLIFSPLAGAIAAGNSVVLKPSEFAPNVAEVIQKMIENNFSSNDITVVCGGVPETTQLLERKFDYIFYTGSTRVGRIIMEKAAKHLTPVTLELGGKSPCVVFGDVDIDLTAKRIIWGKYFNAGQTCIAPDYILVQKELYPSLVEHLKKYIVQFFGKDIKKSEDYGRIVNSNNFHRVKKYMENAKVVYGGETSESELFIAPTLLEVEGNEKVMEEEIFGPLLPIKSINRFDDAIQFINDRARPLALYLFSKNNLYQYQILNQTIAGGVCINDTVVHMTNERMPFGGVGESGMGAYHGRHSFETFSHKKSVMKRYQCLDLPLRYPPYRGKLGLIRLIYKLLSFF